MAEIRLNKPLYKEPPPERGPLGPKPFLIGRVGALILDLLVLSGALLAFAKFAPSMAVQLGRSGGYIGWLCGFVYFALLASPLTHGRSLGKTILRIQVADESGPDLPLGKAFKRSLILLAPLLWFQIAGDLSELLSSPEKLTAIPETVRLFGYLVTAGCYVGYLLYSVFDPFGRGWHDVQAGSIVISSEAEPQLVSEFIRNARETRDPAKTTRARTALILSIAGFAALAAFQTWRYADMIKALPSDKREAELRANKQLYVPGFNIPMPLPERPEATTSTAQAAAEPVFTLNFKYIHYGPIDLERLKKNETAMTALDRITAEQKRVFSNYVRTADKPTSFPARMILKTTFSEYIWLLFAFATNDVYSLSREINLAALVPPDARSRIAVTSGMVTLHPEPGNATSAASPAAVQSAAMRTGQATATAPATTASVAQGSTSPTAQNARTTTAQTSSTSPASP